MTPPRSMPLPRPRGAASSRRTEASLPGPSIAARTVAIEHTCHHPSPQQKEYAMNDLPHPAAADVQGSDRLQSIRVSTDYLGNYQSVNHVRDLPPIHVDEPKELG